MGYGDLSQQPQGYANYAYPVTYAPNLTPQWTSSTAGGNYPNMVSGGPLAKKQAPEIDSVRLKSLPTELREIANQMLADKFG